MNIYLTFTLLLISFNVKSELSYDWSFRGGEVSSVVFILHGASSGGRSNIPLDRIEQFLREGSLVVTPYSGSFTIEDTTITAWDITGQRTNNREMLEFIELLVLAKDLFHKPVYVIGGSSGSLMAYRTYTELLNIGHEGLIDKLVLLDGTSPYAIEVQGRESLAYKSMEVREIASIAQHTYVRPIKHVKSHIYLGLTNEYIRIHTPILILNSVDDTVLPDDIKDEFIIEILSVAENITIDYRGRAHDVGDLGWTYICYWLYYN